jgi:hypothetical protein
MHMPYWNTCPDPTGVAAPQKVLLAFAAAHAHMALDLQEL